MYESRSGVLKISQFDVKSVSRANITSKALVVLNMSQKASRSLTVRGGVFVQDLGILMYIGKILGIFPISVGYRNWDLHKIFHLKYNFFSCTMIYSVMANIFGIFGCAIEVSERSRNMTSSFDIPFYCSATYVFFAPITSFICCARVRPVMAFLRQWSKFETDYKICTGVNLRLKQKKNSQKMCFLIITLPVLLVMKHTIFYVKDYHGWYIPVMCYAIFVRSVADFLWILSFNALAITGRSLALQLKQSIEGSNSSPDTEMVLGEYRDTWIRLSKLTRQTGDVLYPVYSVGFFMYFTLLTLCLYGLLTDTGKDFNYTLDLFLQSLGAFFYLYALTATAHDASLQVGFNIQKELQNLLDQDMSTPTLKEVLSMSVTYIVVLLQVGLSL